MSVFIRIGGGIIRRLLSMGFVLCCVAGCAQKQLGYNVLSYDTAVADTGNQLLLLNAVRASQRYPRSFTSVGQVLAAPAVSGSLAGTFNFASVGGLQNYNLNPTVNAGAGYTQFVLDNLNSQQFMEAIRKPISSKITQSFQRRPGWPRELLSLIYLQELKPTESMVRAIDTGRKAKCIAPSSERDMSLCAAMQGQIDAFSSRCTNHFNDLDLRIRDFRSEKVFYYNTAVNYCSYFRFEIFLMEIRLVGQLICTNEKPDPRCIQPLLRAPLEMIDYLGELIAAQNYIEAPFVPMMLYGGLSEIGGIDFGAAAVSVQHDGTLYYIPRPDFGSPKAARSLQTLDLVLETVQAATHRDDLPKLPSLGVVAASK